MKENFIKPDAMSDDKLWAVIGEMQERISNLEKRVYQSKEILTLEEAALYLGVSRSQLYKLTFKHALPYYKPSGKLAYFERSELTKWLRKNTVKSNEQIDAEASAIMNRLAMK